MSAVVDENNVLQFYTRDYVYSSARSIDHTFRNANSGTDLANIISLTKKDLPSANQVKIIYYTVTSSAYEQNSAPLWTSGSSFLAAAALSKNLLASEIPSSNNKVYVSLNPITVNDIAAEEAIYSFSGHLLIGSEIIEYDAIEYHYIDVDTAQDVTVDITGESDLLKNKGKARINTNAGNDAYKTTFETTKRFRIKTRGAFGTKIADHYVDPKDAALGWSGYKGVVWK
jgi:hypothetical protein